MQSSLPVADMRFPGTHRPARLICAALIALAGGAAAAEEVRNALTIYSHSEPGAIPPELYRPDGGQNLRYDAIPGYAVIRQERDIELVAGVNTVRFTDVAARIDPTTVTFASLTDGPGTRVLEQDYRFDLVSADKLMERYLDRSITVEQIQGDHIGTFTGTLLSTAGGVVLRGEDGTVQVVRHYQNARFPELPGGLISKPTLVWMVSAARAGTHRSRVSYQASGITWWTDYNIVFAEGQDANSGLLDVGAWVSIINQSGAGYPDAKLKLVAGEVHRAPAPSRRAKGAVMMEALAFAPAEDAGFEEKAFFEYHLYTLGRPTTLPDNSTKQIELFPVARGVPCEKVLVYYGLAPEYRGFFGGAMTDREFGTQCNRKVDIYLRFRNQEEAGMGMPLPAGRIRVSKLDPADGTLEFIGEDRIQHTPRNEEVLIKLGSAFDVVGERIQTDFKVDTRRNWMQEAVEIRLRNRKKEAVKVIAKENLYRWSNWKITQSTHPYEKADARTIHFPVQLQPDQEAVIGYTVDYTW